MFFFHYCNVSNILNKLGLNDIMLFFMKIESQLHTFLNMKNSNNHNDNLINE